MSSVESRGEIGYQPEAEISEEKMRHILETEYGVKFVPAENRTVPDKFDFNSFAGVNIPPKILETTSRQFVEYIKMPYVIDTFDTDHEARRKWRDELRTKYGQGARDIVEHNKLRLNKISGIYMKIGVLEQFFEGQGKASDPLAIELRRLRDVIPPQVFVDYKNLSVEEKKLTAGKITDIAVEFLELIKAKEKAQIAAA